MLASAYNKFKTRQAQAAQKRLHTCAQQSFPTRSSTYIRPACDPECVADHLSHCPMALLPLTCPCELSNSAFLASTAIVLGTPTPPHAPALSRRRSMRVAIARADMAQKGDMDSLSSCIPCKCKHLDCSASVGPRAHLVMDFTLGYTRPWPCVEGTGP